MNSNLFSEAMLMPTDPFAGETLNENPLASWEEPHEGMYGNPFQNDGTQLASTFPCPVQNSFADSVLPPGLYAAISNAISQYFQRSPQQNPNMGNPQTFQNVSLSSSGDPHDAVSGTLIGGNQVDEHWDNMQSHGDLLSAPTIPGGFRLSSQVGPANMRGATMNQAVTATTNHGHTAVSLNAHGDATITQGDITSVLAPNQTIRLNPNLSVTDNGNSLTFQARSTNGSMLTTTLTENDQGGVNVSAQGENIALSGYLVNSQSHLQ